MKQKKRVLVIRCGLLGDTVDATSVIEPLIENFENNVEINWVSRPGIRDLFKHDHRIKKVFVLRYTNLSFLFNIDKLRIIFDSFFKPYDLILNLEIGKKFNDIVSISRSKQKIGMPYHFIMDDIFKEVDEELREERLTKIWKRIGPYVIGILSGTIIITSAVIGYREYDETQRQNWGVQFAEAMNLSEEGNWQESLDLFDTLTEKTNLGYKTLSLFQAASLYARNGNKEKALEIYQSLENEALDENFRDLATLMLIYLQFDNADPEILEKRIEKLASKGNPWYYNAVELKGFLFAKQKNKEKQIEIFNILSKDNKAPEGVRTRANDMLAILGEEPQK